SGADREVAPGVGEAVPEVVLLGSEARAEPGPGRVVGFAVGAFEASRDSTTHATAAMASSPSRAAAPIVEVWRFMVNRPWGALRKRRGRDSNPRESLRPLLA